MTAAHPKRPLEIMKLPWLTLLFLVSDATASGVVSDLLAKFERADSSVDSCGSAVLLDGGSQLFCFEADDGEKLNITLSQKITGDEQLTFYVVVLEGGTHRIDWSSAEEKRLRNVMSNWLAKNFSVAEIDHIRWRLDSSLTDPSAAEPITADEQTALLIAGIPNLLETRKQASD